MKNLMITLMLLCSVMAATAQTQLTPIAARPGLFGGRTDKDKDGYTKKTGDCNDNDATIHPGAFDKCNGIDDNCNGNIDEDQPPTIWYADADSDSYGNALVSTTSCTQPAGYVNNSTDCDDTNPMVHPLANEICNGKDDDCAGGIDNGLIFLTWYQDADRDGAGNPAVSVITCDGPPDGYVANSTDCNDADGGVTSPKTYFIDADRDGAGSLSTQLCASTPPLGYSLAGGDCNDLNAAVHSGAFEVYNGIDDDCNGAIDEGCTNPFINGYCDELTQWLRSHVENSMYSEPFNTNYTKFHSSFGTFTNGISTVHMLPSPGKTGSGMNFQQCRPYPGNTQTCGNVGGNTDPMDCSGDGVGCYSHTFDMYPQCMQYYGEHGIATIVNVNSYVSSWTTQKRYIDEAISKNVNVIGIIASTELAVPSWYANSYYFPRGAADYILFWYKFRDSCKKYYPDIPVGIWSGDIWDVKGYHYDWNTGIVPAAATADFIACYGQNQNINNRIACGTCTFTESQVIDSVLAFNWWMNKWIGKMKSTYHAKKLAILTNGTDPAEVAVGTTFIGDMQTEYQIMCEQMDTSRTIFAAQQYRTRMFNLSTPSGATDIRNQFQFRRGTMYSVPTHKEWIATGNRLIVGIRFTKADGHGWIEVLNFDSRDWPAPGNVEGWSSPLLGYTRSAVYYTGTAIKGNSIGFVTF